MGGDPRLPRQLGGWAEAQVAVRSIVKVQYGVYSIEFPPHQLNLELSNSIA